MGKKVIAYCTPSLGMVSILWARAWGGIFHENNYAKSVHLVRDNVGDEVAECRNALVEQVLDYDANVQEVTHLFWVDDDVLVFEGCLLELLHQYADIVSGVYFLKYPGNLTSPLIYPENGGGPARFIPDHVYEDVWGHGMGLTLIRAEVYKRMRDELLTRDVDGVKQKLTDKYGRYRWYHRTDSMTEIVRDEHGIAMLGMTEDNYFLDLAHRIGYKSRVVTTKHAFGFHFDANKDQGYPQKQWEQYISGAPIIWDTPDGPVQWD